MTYIYRFGCVTFFLITTFFLDSVQGDMVVATPASPTSLVASPSIVATAQPSTLTGIVNADTGEPVVPRDTSRLGLVANMTSPFDIVLSFGPTMAANTAAVAAFNRAAAQWEARISDPITVNYNADFATLAFGVLGNASACQFEGPYSGFLRGLIVADAADEPDDAIVSSLPGAPPALTAKIPATPAGFTLEDSLTLTSSNYRAIDNANEGDCGTVAKDGTINFTNHASISWDFDNSNGVTPGAYDFETVAAHEIGHQLGFISIVDNVTNRINNNLGGSAIRPTPLDLFRFEDGTTNDPSTAGEFTTKPRNLLPHNPAITDQISLGYGTIEMAMSTGILNGVGQQASHFLNQSVGLLGPSLAPGMVTPVSENDFRAIDLIGYEVSAVPEPSSFLFLGLTILVCVTGRMCQSDSLHALYSTGE